MTSALLLLLAGLASGGEPRVELYTMGLGNPLFERFGHAAICVVHDSAPARSRCFNYGTTDFDTPPQQLGWSFLRGGAVFWVSVWNRDEMLNAYVRSDRSIWRQRLGLEPAQIQHLVRRLDHDARAENRRYQYHHFRDNCATRVRDLIDEAAHGKLSHAGRDLAKLSYRALGRCRLGDMTALLLASDLLVGRKADRHPNGYQAMFLPSFLRAAVSRQLGVKPELVYARTRPLPGGPQRGGRGWCIALALLLAVPWLAARRRPRLQSLAAWLQAGVLGLLGALVWAVAALSTVPELRYNEALVLLWPTDVVLPMVRASIQRHYGRVRLVVLLCGSLLLALGVFKQPLGGWLLVPLLPFLVRVLGAVPAERSADRRATD